MQCTKRFSDLEVYDPKNAPDNWQQGADRISTHARDDVLATFAIAGAEAVVSEPAGAQAAMDGLDAVADTGYFVKRLCRAYQCNFHQ